MLRRKREERRRNASSATELSEPETDSSRPRSGRTITPAERRQKARDERDQMMTDRLARREKMRETREKEETENAARKRRGSIKDGPRESAAEEPPPEIIVINATSVDFDDQPPEEDGEEIDPYTGRRRSIKKQSHKGKFINHICHVRPIRNASNGPTLFLFGRPGCSKIEISLKSD